MRHHLQKLALAVALALPSAAHAADRDLGPREEACLHSIPSGSLGPEATAEWEKEHSEKLTYLMEPCRRERRKDEQEAKQLALHPIPSAPALSYGDR